MRHKRIEEKIMIQTFADKETEKVYNQKFSKNYHKVFRG